MQVLNPSPGAIYSGLTNAVTTITRLEGLASLWRGMTSVIVGAGKESKRFRMALENRLLELEVLHMPSTSLLMRQSSKLWVVMNETLTIHSLRVYSLICEERKLGD